MEFNNPSFASPILTVNAVRIFDLVVDVGEIPGIVPGEIVEIKEMLLLLLLLIMVLLFEEDKEFIYGC